jgi:mono/diheme cytochrome c family protein
MKIKSILCIAAALVFVLLLSACGGSETSDVPADRPEPPEEFAELKNPLEGVDTALNAGKETYNVNCASCHGDTGLGDGPIGSSLNPEPGNLAEDQKTMSDGYLYWRIADGGIMEPFNSAMPSWKGVMSGDQIWEVVTYIRSLGN